MCFANYTLKEKEVTWYFNMFQYSISIEEKEVTWYFNMFQYSISIVNAIEIKIS